MERITFDDIVNELADKYSSESFEFISTHLQKRGITADRHTGFPLETVEKVYVSVEKYLKLYSQKEQQTRYKYARDIAHIFFDSYYSFTDHLRTGHYAPYLHEKDDEQIGGSNCTTIIPNVYLYCEVLGLKPQIVQFFDFRDIETKKDLEDPLYSKHFSVIVDVGRKHRYLLDPFYHTFGPILEQNPNYLKVGRCQGRSARKREFSEMLPYSVEDFVKMMGRLHQPAESLDMLIPGQKVHQDRTVFKVTKCNVMVYYDPEKNLLSSRLYVPQKPIQDKAVYARMQLDDQGEVADLSLECYLAKDFDWASLVGGKKVCETDFTTMRSLRRKIQSLPTPDGKKVRLERHPRFGFAFLEADDQMRESLTDLTKKMYQGLTNAEQLAIRSQILARALYESECPEQEYLFSPQEHDARLLKLAKQEKEDIKNIKPLEDLLYFHGWKLQKFEKNEVRRMRYASRRHIEKMSEIVEEINRLNNLRWNNKRAYSRAMDKVLFAEKMLGRMEEVEQKVAAGNLDLRLGYLALVTDFVPFVLEGQKELELDGFMDPIKEKVKARRAIIQPS